METTKVILDGKEIEIVTKLDEDFYEMALQDENTEKTMELTNVLDHTQEIEIGEINE